MNTIKTILLLGLLTALLIWLGSIFGGQQGALIGLLIALGMNFFSYWFSDSFVLKVYGAKVIEEKENPELFSMVKNISDKAKLPMPRIAMIDLPTPNAFATGRNPSKGVVAVSNSLLSLLSKEELAGVLAHEISHIKNRDVLISSIAAVIAGAISYIAQFGMFFGGSNSDEEGNSNPLVGILFLIITPIIALLIQMAISRAREFSADKTAREILGDGKGLASALQKLHNAVEIRPLLASPVQEATSHLFITNPFKISGLMNLFSTHPPFEERIQKLLN